MISNHFQPFLGDHRPCWHCHHFEALVYGDSAALCGLPGGPRVRASPASGCAFWEREVGADDDPDRVPPGSDWVPPFKLPTRMRSTSRQ